jgi:hypothetical protein
MEGMIPRFHCGGVPIGKSSILSHVGAFQRAISSCRLDFESLGGAGLMNNARLHCADFR